MSELANTLQFDSIVDEICRDERCERLDIHVCGPSACLRGRGGRESLYRTRSRKFAGQPWRAYNADALRVSVFNAVSFYEPRNFATILSQVENDYGSCCERSVHRHLGSLRQIGTIVRMDFKGRLHAYLRAGSRMLHEPDLVLEQILDLHAIGLEQIEQIERDEFKTGGRQGSFSGFTDAAYAR